MQRKPMCCNCVFAGYPFKIDKKTHMHCQHEKYEIEKIGGGEKTLDSLMEFWNTCVDHQFKKKK